MPSITSLTLTCNYKKNHFYNLTDINIIFTKEICTYNS